MRKLLPEPGFLLGFSECDHVLLGQDMTVYMVVAK